MSQLVPLVEWAQSTHSHPNQLSRNVSYVINLLPSGILINQDSQISKHIVEHLFKASMLPGPGFYNQPDLVGTEASQRMTSNLKSPR